MANILVVDDRPVNREFLAMLLGYAGHRVLEAADGNAGLEVLGQTRPDLVISDIVMPTMDGVEFARRLRAEARFADIPIIFYTASYRLNDAQNLARRCGVSAVISKPSKPQLILDTVATVLGVPVPPAPKWPAVVAPPAAGGHDFSLSLRLAMLLELGLELAAERDPQRLLELVCRAGREFFNSEYAAVGVDAAAGRSRRFASAGYAEGAGAWLASFDPGDGILALATVSGEGKPRRLPDLAGNSAADGVPADHPAIDALLVVPLVSALRSSYGWMLLARRPGGAAFDETDEQLAVTLAASLALAYDNLTWYDAQQRYAARLEADSEAIRRLNADLAQEVKARKISETRFRLAMEVGAIVAFTMDLDLRYTWVHSSQIGFNDEEVLGKTEFDLFDEETARRLTALYRQVIASGTGLRRDVTVRSRARLVEQDFELMVEPLKDEADAVTGIVCAAVDITNRKWVEAELRVAKADAERADNAKSRFLAAASHDLRQPLSALSIYARMLDGQVAPAGRPLLANLRDCVGSLSALLTDLLDLSKLEAGVVTPNRVDFPLADVLASLQAAHAPEAALKGIQLRVVRPEVTAHTDPVLFRRILGNLLENAIRYTERGGVLVGCRRRQGKIWVEVWDTGLGIHEDKTQVIFEEFKQLGDDARNRGSGLGLAIVARTAALLGLEIRLRSKPGRGSLFAIELPLGQAAVIAAPVPADATFRPLFIALVDDNAMVRQALALALQGTGHQVLAAATGQELLAGLGRLRPDVLVSDYRLAEGETGFDVITAVRAAVGADLPAILITGDTDPKLMRAMADRGFVVLHKPLNLETLQAYLDDMTSA